jgi:hypothetical protein
MYVVCIFAYYFTSQAQSAIGLMKLCASCLVPSNLARYMNSSFRCMKLFPQVFRDSFQPEGETSPFGGKETVFPALIFYACLGMYSQDLTPDSLSDILRKVRGVIHPPISSEDDFVWDMVDLFFAPKQVSFPDIKQQVVLRVWGHQYTNDSERERGRYLLLRCSKLHKDILTDDFFGYFVFHYFPDSSQWFTTPSQAVDSFLSIVALFSSYNVSLPGQVTRTSSWLDKLADRMYKVFLIRNIFLAKIEDTPAHRAVGKILIVPVNEFSRKHSGPELYTTHLETAPPTIPISPELHPQASPASPPSLEDDGLGSRPSPRSISPPSRPFPLSPPPVLESPPISESSRHTQPIGAKELVKQSLINSGMSVERADQIASKFVAGGDANLEALRRVLAKASEPTKNINSF